MEPRKRPVLRIIALVLLAVGWFALLRAVPGVRGLGFKGLEAAVFAGAVAAAVLSLWWRPGAWGLVLAWTLALLAFGLPLLFMWSGGQHAATVMLGLFQVTDAGDYERGALVLWHLGTLDGWDSRRPLMATFLAGLFAADDGNMQVTQALLTLLNAGAALLAARALTRSHGMAAGFLAFATLFCVYITQTGSFMSENLGLPLGCLAFVLLWDGLRAGRAWLIWAGLLFLSLALNARAGAFFVLPALILWLGWRDWRADRGRAVRLALAATAAAALGFLPGALLRHAYGPADSAGFSNFAQTLYGLVVGGKFWTQIYRDHPEIAALPDAVQARTTYHLAWQAFLAAPYRLALGILRAYFDYFLSAKWLRFFDVVAVRAAAILLLLLGLRECWRNRREDWAAFLLVVTLGVVLSVPFLMDGGPRVFAATLPVTAALIGLGTMPILRRAGAPLATLPSNPAPALALAVLLLLMAGPLAPLYAGRDRHPANAPPICAAGLDAVAFMPRPDSAIVVLPPGDKRSGRLPYVGAARFAADNPLNLSPGLAPPFWLGSIYDRIGRRMVWIAAATDRLPPPSQLVTGCARMVGQSLVLEKP